MKISDGDEVFRLGYPRDTGEEDILDITLEQIAKVPLSLEKIGDSKLECYIHRGNETIWHVWRKAMGLKFDIMWRPMDLEEFVDYANDFGRFIKNVNKIVVKEVEPRIDIGRCEVCHGELASMVVEIQHVHEHRFCNDCFAAFADAINGKT